MSSLELYADRVLDGLWVSEMPEPGWDLDGCGVRLVVSLSEHLPPHAARRFEWGTHGDAAGAGRIIFVHWPFKDGPLPAWDACMFATQTVVAAVRHGWTTLVHCQEGRNRSGLIAALAVRELTGCSGADAVAKVRAARPGMLSNRVFANALEQLPPPAPVP